MSEPIEEQDRRRSDEEPGEAESGSSESKPSGTARRNPASNLSVEDRRRGGQRSAQQQQRDEQGHFAGKAEGAGGRKASRKEGGKKGSTHR